MSFATTSSIKMASSVAKLTRKQLVALLKEHKGKDLPSEYDPPSSVVICLPTLCSYIPRETSIAFGLRSCHQCDIFRGLMDVHGRYKNKDQQQFSRRYSCQSPGCIIRLSLVAPAVPLTPSTVGNNDSQDSMQSSSTAYSMSLRKRKVGHVYSVPDSDASDIDEEPPCFKRIVKHVVHVLPDNEVNEQDTSNVNLPPTTTTTTAETSTSTITTNEPPVIVTGSPAIPVPNAAEFETISHHIHIQTDAPKTIDISTQTPILGHTLISTSLAPRWKRQIGRTLAAKLLKAVKEEDQTDKHNATKSKRKVNIDLLSQVIWYATGFAYITRQTKTRANGIVLSLFRKFIQWKPDLFHEAVLAESRQFLRREVFNPWKFQKSIDTNAAGGLNYESCNSIRKDVEELGANRIGTIPHGNTISLYARLLEKHAVEDHGLSINVEKTTHGPSLYFDLDNFLRMILVGFGLDKYAQTGSGHKPVMIAHTLDGAMLTSHLGHVTAGIKIVDPRATDPVTGLPILGSGGLFQTRDLCFPTNIVFGKDCKSLYADCFADFHSKFNGGLLIPATVDSPELSNFLVISPQDMSSIWKTTGLGGGSFNKKQFCYACMCDNDLISVFTSGAERCDTCKRLNIDSCFCHPVNDRSFLEDTSLLLQEYIQSALDEGFQKLEDFITANTKININPFTTNRQSNKNHIDFVPTCDSEVLNSNNLLKTELRLRIKGKEELKSVLDGNMAFRRSKLKSLIATESKITLARKTIQRQDMIPNIAEKVLAEEAVPCILRMEMRISEKLYWSLLSMGLDRYQDGESKVRKLLIEKVTECMKTMVLGNEDNGTEYQWKFPLKDGGKKVEPKSMTGVHSRRCVMGIKTLAAIIFDPKMDEKSKDTRSTEQTRQKNALLLEKWEQLMDTYLPMMSLIRKHEDFSDSEIDQLHVLTSSFMSQWVDLFQGQSITNYIHMIGAGHLTYFLTKYRNLYKYSQQGWEAYNQKLKYFYFHNTNHGGCGGNKPGAVSGDHVMPLMKMVQRSVMWTLGFGDTFFRGTVAKTFQEDNESVTVEDETMTGVI